MLIMITAFESALFRERRETVGKERFWKGAQPLAEFRLLQYHRNAVQFGPGHAATIQHDVSRSIRTRVREYVYYTDAMLS